MSEFESESDSTRFAGCKPVITQNEIRGKVVQNKEREAGVVTTVISQVGSGELDA